MVLAGASSSGLPSDPVAWSSRWCRLCAGASLRKLLDEFPHPRRVAARAVCTWKAGLLPLPSYFSVLVLVYGCCLWSTAYWIFRDACATWVQLWIHVLREAFGRIHRHFSTLRCTRILRRLTSILVVCRELRTAGLWK